MWKTSAVPVPVVGVAVGPAEERRGVRVGGQGLRAARPAAGRGLAGQLVDAVVGDALGGGPHGDQAPFRQFELSPFGVQHGASRTL